MKQLLALFALTFLFSCASEPEQKLESLDKKSAREVTLMTVNQGDSVLHLTKQIIWSNGEKIAEQVDTIITPKKINSWDDTSKITPMNEVPIYVTVQ